MRMYLYADAAFIRQSIDTKQNPKRTDVLRIISGSLVNQIIPRSFIRIKGT